MGWVGDPRLKETGMQCKKQAEWQCKKGKDHYCWVQGLGRQMGSKAQSGSPRPAGPKRLGHIQQSEESEGLVCLWVKMASPKHCQKQSQHRPLAKVSRLSPGSRDQAGISTLS